MNITENGHHLVKEKEHFIFLEWLRFLLGVYIIMFHTFHYNGVSSWVRHIFDMGFFATSAFFVLSGFLLAHVYLREHTKPTVHLREPPKSFLIKRFSNLYPIHILSMILMVVVVVLMPILQIIPNDISATIRYVVYDVNDGSPGDQIKHFMTNTELAVAFLMNILMIQSWNPFYLSLNFPTWSIATLFFFYLVFPYIAPRLHLIKKPLLGLLGVNIIYLIPVILIIMYSDFGMPVTGLLHRNPIIRLPEFMAGILLCSLYHRQKEAGFKLTWMPTIALWVFIALSLYGANYLLSIAPTLSKKGNIPYYLLHDGILLPAQVALIYLCTQIKFQGSKKFQTISQRLGSSSLPLFALHIPLYMIFVRCEKLITGDKSLYSYPVFLVITIIICVLFQERIVVKFRKLIQKKLLKPKSP